MKIRPVILCGGAGTRLWPNQKNHEAKQFIDFGGWSLIQKTLARVKNPIFDYPIISTNLKYLKQVRHHLKKNKVKVLLDVPCGDHYWMSKLDFKDLGVNYIGADIVQQLIKENQKKYRDKYRNFIQFDLVNDTLVDMDCDVIVIWVVLQLC